MLQEAARCWSAGRSGWHTGTEPWSTPPAHHRVVVVHILLICLSFRVGACVFSPHLACWFHTLKDAKVDEDPSQQENKEQLPAQHSCLVYSSGLLQHLMSSKKRAKKDNEKDLVESLKSAVKTSFNRWNNDSSMEVIKVAVIWMVSLLFGSWLKHLTTIGCITMNYYTK